MHADTASTTTLTVYHIISVLLLALTVSVYSTMLPCFGPAEQWATLSAVSAVCSVIAAVSKDQASPVCSVVLLH
jgi:hypothetical protein